MSKLRMVVGIHSCAEVLKVRPKKIQQIFLKPDWQKNTDLKNLHALAEKVGLKPQIIAINKLDQLSQGHQGVACQVSETPELNWSQLKTKHSCILGLDGIEDPHNLGAIMRSAWLLGCEGILIPKDRAVSLTPTACKIASGGAEHIPVEEHTQLATPIKILKEKGYWVFGLSEKAHVSLWDIEIPEQIIWVIGGEGAGIRVQTEKVCDQFVSIPQVSKGPSYNASVAAAITLAETHRQWHQKPRQK